jgi:hypothetical protein
MSVLRFVFKEAHRPRFNLGQKVVITGPVVTKYRGCQATVIGVHPNEHTSPGVTVADKYIVRFDEGDDAEFFEIQLDAVKERKNRA